MNSLARLAMMTAALGVALPFPEDKVRAERAPTPADAERILAASVKRMRKGQLRLTAQRMRDLDRRHREMHTDGASEGSVKP